MNRQITARRAAESSRTSASPSTASKSQPVSRNLLLRVDKIDTIKPVRKAPCTKMTGAARCASGSGKRSLWAASQNYRTGVTVDSRWSA